ncbi:DnaJ C-terminal domain-containing protein [Georgenia sp. Z1491]|uniref:DnaJ C-terminal domain-containing protein n=1 Tax=Georgenia sp. Z1491 TaxID=3416707 RepID=UPI003CEF3F8A
MAGQDWLEKDFYQVLGVSKDADADTIKKAYRKLARTHHPDQNPGDAKAEETFKKVGEAYAVLSDPKERSEYDALRAMAGGRPRFSGGPAGGAGASGFEDVFSSGFGAGGRGQGYASAQDAPGFDDILSSMFGSAAPSGFGSRRRAQRGQDVLATTTLPFRQAVDGSTVELTVDGRAVTTRIPPGVRDGQKIKIPGKGRPGSGGAPAGDLIITVEVTPHPVFTLDGANLRLTVPVTFDEAALGATVEIPTLDGESVRLKVPAGTPSGRTLRVRKHGVKRAKGVPGDLLVTVNVVVPSRLSAAARKAVEDFAAANGDVSPRDQLFEQARR